MEQAKDLKSLSEEAKNSLKKIFDEVFGEQINKLVKIPGDVQRRLENDFTELEDAIKENNNELQTIENYVLQLKKDLNVIENRIDESIKIVKNKTNEIDTEIRQTHSELSTTKENVVKEIETFITDKHTEIDKKLDKSTENVNNNLLQVSKDIRMLKDSMEKISKQHIETTIKLLENKILTLLKLILMFLALSTILNLIILFLL